MSNSVNRDTEKVKDQENGDPAKGAPQDAPIRKSPSFLQVMLSVVAAAFGVQTGKNYERDFTTGSPLPYIIGGIVFTVLFVLTIVGVVSLVLP